MTKRKAALRQIRTLPGRNVLNLLMLSDGPHVLIDTLSRRPMCIR